MIIALAGKKLSGKGTAADYLIKTHNATVMRFSAILQDILTRLHQEYTRENLVNLGTGLRKLYGDDVLAQVLRSDIQLAISKPVAADAVDATAEKNIFIIDGMRFQAEYDILHDLPDFSLWYVDASLETRFARTKIRTEKSDEVNMTLEEFTRREEDATEQEIAGLQVKADLTLNNNGSFEDFYSQIDSGLA